MWDEVLFLDHPVPKTSMNLAYDIFLSFFCGVVLEASFSIEIYDAA